MWVANPALYWDLSSGPEELVPTPIQRPGPGQGARKQAMQPGPQQRFYVQAAELQHRVPCWGYVFREVQPASGPDAPPNPASRKVVILGDTVNSRAIAPLAAGCDVLSHEATFARGMEAKAQMAQHSTGWMAGAFARAVRAQRLVLTHFSARYREAPKVSRMYKQMQQIAIKLIYSHSCIPFCC